MIEAREAVVWWNEDAGRVAVTRRGDRPDPRLAGTWCDEGANFAAWHDLTDEDRVRLMLETGIDLMVRGPFDPRAVIRELARVREFHALAAESHPMRRAINLAESV